MGSLVNTRNIDYNVAYYEKESFESIPNNIEGSIAITVDKATMTAIHNLVYYGQVISAFYNGAASSPYLDNKYTLCHAMIVLQKEGQELTVIDADIEASENRNGICRSKYRLDKVSDITGIVIITPKSEEVRVYNIFNATLELTPHMEKRDIMPYDTMKAWQSCFSTSHLYSPHENIAETKEELAEAISHYIHFENVTDSEGKARTAICSSFATRVLQSSVLMTSLKEEELRDYRKMSPKEASEHIYTRMNTPGDDVAELLTTNELFQLDHRWTLPYQLFDAVMMRSSFFHEKNTLQEAS